MKKITFEDLKNKVCVITGGSGVIGSELTKGLASVGVNLALIGRNENKASDLANKIEKEFNVKTIAIASDVTDEYMMQNAKEKILEKYGTIDFLINCAGGNHPDATTSDENINDKNINSPSKTIFGLNIDGIKNTFDLNIMGTILPTIIFSKEMVERKSGVILNISSMASFRPLTKIPAYSASKASVNNFTEWLSVHFANVNIRVNAIAPGFFLTEQNKFLLIDKKTNELSERGKKIIAATPMKRFGETTELIGATLFLLSDLSKFITGITLPVDGGFNAYSGV